MAEWAAFAGIAGVVTVLLLALSHATKTALTGSGVADSRPADGNGDGRPPDRAPSDAAIDGRDATPGSAVEREFERGPTADPLSPAEHTLRGPAREGTRLESLSTGELLANVALSQGLFAALLMGAAVYARVPPDALGIAFTGAYVRTGVLVGTGLGLALYAANELGSAVAERFGFDHDESLRSSLAPDGTGGWLVLLGLVLPLVAVFEEFLFRAALIGAIGAGFDVPVALLVVVSSVAFALGHGLQGPTGVAVTGLLGLVLAGAFVRTGSLLVVVVAHYLINALEFAVHEGLGIEWADGR